MGKESNIWNRGLTESIYNNMCINNYKIPKDCITNFDEVVEKKQVMVKSLSEKLSDGPCVWRKELPFEWV